MRALTRRKEVLDMTSTMSRNEVLAREGIDTVERRLYLEMPPGRNEVLAREGIDTTALATPAGTLSSVEMRY